jgi:hypothetical protein
MAMSDQPRGFYSIYLERLAARPRDPDADGDGHRQRADDEYWATKRRNDAERDKPRGDR